MAELKTKKTDASVSAFLNKIEDPQKRADSKAIAKMMGEITGLKPSLWGGTIVGYGTYRYEYASGRSGDWPLVAFSPRKQNIVLYIMPGFREYEGMLARLGKHKTGKSCLYINRLSDVDAEVLEEIVERSVEYMVEKYG
ncbi:MAG: DUF1801 domain-containing protein [Alphaproteobacteria bacterium]|nr:DUF1801 domain-containing protein [Alphaproteobacteria bacterium]